MVLQADEVVELVYELLLKRKPEAGALQHWSTALTDGLTHDQFVQAVLGSSEFRRHLGTADTHDDVDLVIPMMGRQLRVPASDRDLVPTLLRDRTWEPHLTRYLLRELRPSDVFLDAGANLGYFTVLCAPLVDRVDRVRTRCQDASLLPAECRAQRVAERRIAPIRVVA